MTIQDQSATAPVDTNQQSCEASAVGALWQVAEAGSAYVTDPAARIVAIRHGIPAAAVGGLAARMGMCKEPMLTSLELPRIRYEKSMFKIYQNVAIGQQ